MKKIFLTILAALFVFSCTLGESGRTGMLEIAVASPDIYKDMVSSSIPDRTIMGDTEWLGVIIYPTFAADPHYESNVPPSRSELDFLMARKDAVYAQIDYSGSDGLFYTFSDLEPGDWTVLIFSADYTGGSFETIDAFNDSLTFKYKEITIEKGFNQVDVPLVLNSEVFWDFGTGEAGIPVDVENDYGNAYQHDGDMSSVIMVFSNIAAGEWRLAYYLDMISFDELDIRFYDMEGRFLNLERKEGGTYDYWIYQSESASTMLLMTATPRVPLMEGMGGPLYIDYYNDNYLDEPPRPMGEIYIYSGGV